jgi:hypothetical protein
MPHPAAYKIQGRTRLSRHRPGSHTLHNSECLPAHYQFATPWASHRYDSDSLSPKITRRTNANIFSLNRKVDLSEQLKIMQVSFNYARQFVLHDVLELYGRQPSINSESSIKFINIKVAACRFVAKSHLAIEKHNDFYMIVVAKLQRLDFLHFQSGRSRVIHVEIAF